ncbi:polyphosphate kinase 2 family protein [Mucilaginibacter sp.]|jgi:PPK2 family polyphosphate:nucleotide phosphotransferase|uniref:polyphosphate kinase 2 family protein n=1 Tax=Mucilaginibacter sp. TaxID=1882438 RepID=UPI002BA302C4|nr:polyphosphate kinase 2 family protein [Mucilaginibacter sp.]HTI61386.1 polyphosphate kinase 2 family protein [Mucilaginibacter sp.]
MRNLTDRFRITGDKKFSIQDFDTAYAPDYKKGDAETILSTLIKQTAEAETELYASNRYALLIIFQAMDAAGKDSAIKHTMSGLNPQGCQVYSFKQPSITEYDHDFLWRHYVALPERGRIGIFNRSHYENVLVTKVHPELLAKENLPGSNSLEKMGKDFWKNRYESIRDFEKHLHRNGTIIVKFFLHVSKAEQKKRFLERIDDPAKNWKFSTADVEERKYWDQYMDAYEMAIKETATPENPWYVIPADKKWFTRIAISTTILDILTNLKLKYPVLPGEELKKLQSIKQTLEKE